MLLLYVVAVDPQVMMQQALEIILVDLWQIGYSSWRAPIRDDMAWEDLGLPFPRPLSSRTRPLVDWSSVARRVRWR